MVMHVGGRGFGHIGSRSPTGEATGIPEGWQGISEGLITERATPGAGVLLAEGVLPWVAGQPRPALANGNSSNIPTAHATLDRIDILQSDGTWKSGTAAAAPDQPAPDSGKAWIAAVCHRANNEVVKDFDDGTNSFIVAINRVTEAQYTRYSGSSQTTTSGSSVDATGTRVSVYADHAMSWAGCERQDQANCGTNGALTTHFKVAGADLIATGRFMYGRVPRLSLLSTGNYQTITRGAKHLAAGATEIIGRWYRNTGTGTASSTNRFTAIDLVKA